MTDPSMRRRAIALHDGFIHGGQDRRAFLAALARLAGGAAAANALLATIAADPAAAAMVQEDDPRLDADYVGWERNGRALSGYLVRPRAVAMPPGVVILHENRGLTPYIRDVARRAAVAGFVALAPDLLSPAGGTPADEDAGRAMIATLDLAAATADTLGAARWLGRERRSNGRVGLIGFCWGGAMVGRAAVAGGKAIDAGVAFYGPAPEPGAAGLVEAPLLYHFAGLDKRVNRSGAPWIAALRRAGKPVESYDYPGVDHAFHNDASAARFDVAAASLAWQRTLAFLTLHLA